MSELCLTLLCPPAIEEKLLDLLLMSPNIATVFTSTPTAAHGLAHENLDQTEQVLGRALPRITLPQFDYKKPAPHKPHDHHRPGSRHHGASGRDAHHRRTH